MTIPHQIRLMLEDYDNLESIECEKKKKKKQTNKSLSRIELISYSTLALRNALGELKSVIVNSCLKSI